MHVYSSFYLFELPMYLSCFPIIVFSNMTVVFKMRNSYVVRTCVQTFCICICSNPI